MYRDLPRFSFLCVALAAHGFQRPLNHFGHRHADQRDVLQYAKPLVGDLIGAAVAVWNTIPSVRR